jgi:hypothetical protein
MEVNESLERFDITSFTLSHRFSNLAVPQHLTQ